MFLENDEYLSGVARRGPALDFILRPSSSRSRQNIKFFLAAPNKNLTVKL
jgi:hypothetical protein